MADYECLIIDRTTPGVGVVILNRPEKLNALSFALATELDDALTRFEADNGVRAIVITGAGSKAFSAGADIHEIAAASPVELGHRLEARHRFSWHLATSKKPTIGAINGLAYGGAAFLATTLDIRIGCERTSFRFIGAARGMLSSTWSLPLVVGPMRARELLYTARVIAADEALQFGLLNHVVPSGQLLETAVSMAQQIADNVPEVVEQIKQLIISGVGATIDQAHDAEYIATGDVLKRTSMAKAFSSFLVDRRPTE